MQRPSLRLEELEPRYLLSATVFEHDDIGYFLDQEEPQIERYDIANETWLSPVILSDATGPASVGHVNDSGLFVAEGRSVYRYSQDGSGRTHLADATRDVIAIHSDGDLLLINHSGNYRSSYTTVDTTSNTVVGTFIYVSKPTFGSSIAPSLNLIFGRRSPNLTYVRYDDTGAVTGGGTSSESRYYPNATQTWLFPDESKVVDNSGTIYRTSDLRWWASLPASFDDIGFVGDDIPIVLSGNSVTAFTSYFSPAGSAVLAGAPSQIFVNDANVIAFTPDTGQPTGFRTEVVPLSELNTPTPGGPIDPVGLPYTPHDVELAADGTVLLLSRLHDSVFRWDPASRRYVDSFRLAGRPEHMTYSADTNTAYLAYESGLIRALDLNVAEPVETPFVTLAGYPRGLYTAGPFVFAANYFEGRYDHYTLHPDGTQADKVRWMDGSSEYVWNDANQKMYYTQTYAAPLVQWVEVNADGVSYPAKPPGGIGGRLSAGTDWIAGYGRPIRVAPDGSVMVVASGAIHDARTLERLPPTLANYFADAAWLGGGLYTMRNQDGTVEFQHWRRSTYELERTATQIGTAHSLLSLPYHLLGIRIGTDGVPLFSVMDESLEPVPFSSGFVVGETDGATSVSESGTTDTLEVILENQPSGDVVIAVSGNDSGEVTVTPASLRFSPYDWYQPQVVTLTGRNDDDVDGSQTSFVTLSVDERFSDESFWNVPDRTIAVVTVDDETAVSAIAEHGGVGYFFVENDSRIERYDMGEQTWLSSLRLADAPGAATVGHVDDDGIYVAYGRAVYRYSLDGSEPVHLVNTPRNVIAIHSDGNLLLLNQTDDSDARMMSVDKTTRAVLDTFAGFYLLKGSSIAPDVNRIFGISVDWSPADINFLDYDDNGQFTANRDSPYHGDYQRAQRTWVFPDNARMVDSSGIIYSTSDLTYRNSFPVSMNEIDEIVFLGDDPIVLSGNKVTKYTADILPSGEVTLSDTPTQIFVNDASVIAFTPNPSQPTGFVTEVVPLADLNPPEPVAPVNPAGLAYTPDRVELAADGTVLLYSKSHQHIFRWDPQRRNYVDSIPLVGAATYMAYAPELNRVFLAYDSGLIQSLDLDAADPVEMPFATLPGLPGGLAMAGRYVFAADTTGSWLTHYTFAADGTLVDSVDFTDYSLEYVWSDVNQKMYHFRWATKLAWTEVNADGATYPDEPPGGIGAGNSMRLQTSDRDPYPLRIAPDGSVIVLGPGSIFDATTLERKRATLANRITAATWLGGELYTIRDHEGAAQFQQWVSPDFAPGLVAETPGRAHTLIAIDRDRLLAVTLGAGGVPVFTLLDENLEYLPGGRVDTTLVLAPTPETDLVTGEIDALPENAEWLDEWTDFYVEFWVSNPGGGTAGVERSSFDFAYNTDYYTAVNVEFGPAFAVGRTELIDDLAGRVSLEASTAATDAGDDRPALLARIRFAPTAADPGVPHNADGHYVLPVSDLGFSLQDAGMDLGGGSPVEPELGNMPAPELWPVMYDIDDDGKIFFSDFSFFAAAFLRRVEDSGGHFTWACDFDHSGRVLFADLSYCAPNFGQRWDSARPVVYPSNFPEDWRSQPLRAALGTPPVKLSPPEPVSHDNHVGSLLGSPAEIDEAAPNDANAAAFGRLVETYEGRNNTDDVKRNPHPLFSIPHSALRIPHSMDLPTRVLHKPSHVLGDDHEDEGLMDDALPFVTRRLPEAFNDWPAEAPLDDLEDLDAVVEQTAVDPDALDRVFVWLD